jgi:hypothetical protein
MDWFQIFLFLHQNVCMGLPDRWILKKNFLGGFGHKDLARRISFRCNSILSFCICFLKKHVYMPTPGCFLKVSPFSILYCLKNMFVLWCPVLASFDSYFFISLPVYPRLTPVTRWDIHNMCFSWSSIEVVILEYIWHFPLKFGCRHFYSDDLGK